MNKGACGWAEPGPIGHAWRAQPSGNARHGRGRAAGTGRTHCPARSWGRTGRGDGEQQRSDALPLATVALTQGLRPCTQWCRRERPRIRGAGAAPLRRRVGCACLGARSLQSAIGTGRHGRRKTRTREVPRDPTLARVHAEQNPVGARSAATNLLPVTDAATNVIPAPEPGSNGVRVVLAFPGLGPGSRPG
jgi:hypothetical protein